MRLWPWQVRERDQLRRNWISHFTAGGRWDYGFFVGASAAVGPLQTRLTNHMLGDMVWLPEVADDYGHLTRKILAAIKWTLHHINTRCESTAPCGALSTTAPPPFYRLASPFPQAPAQV